MARSAVPLKMRQIIGGKLYDITTAMVVASDEYWDGHNHHRRGRNTVLYKTLRGNFFVGNFTLWQGERDYLEPCTLKEAKDYYENLPKQEISYGEAFGEEPEEA